ncbi:MAG TPA: GvpL/GvpF family gas vesicle protein [Terriglobales bacterium]|nr:GvpL/GvpF family gas vesicle protein [Terriglobales bacterium]
MAGELKGDRRVIYLYGITESPGSDISELVGVDRLSKVETIECDGVYCWISRVSAVDFEKELAQNMENLDWLAETSVAHQRVIGAIAHETEILPARLGTVFRSKDSLCKHVRKRARGFKGDFARIKDADEWGVKVFQLEAAAPKPANVRSGTDYLKAKAAMLKPRRRKAATDGEIASFERALERVAVETAPAGNVSRGQRGLMFQATLLIRRSNKKKLESLLEKFARQWSSERRIECTGPWPPYSFVSRPTDGAKPV